LSSGPAQTVGALCPSRNEAAAGGTPALVADGDIIERDIAACSLNLDVDPAELDRRREAWPGRSRAAISTF